MSEDESSFETMGENPTHPDHGHGEDAFASFETADGALVVYDRDNPKAWIRSDSHEVTAD